MRFFIFFVKYLFQAHTSREMFEVKQELSSNVIHICHRCRDKFEPFRKNADLAVAKLLVWKILYEFLVIFSLSLNPFFSHFFFLRSLRLLFVLYPFLFWTPVVVVRFSEIRLLYFSTFLLFAEFCNTCVYNICLSSLNTKNTAEKSTTENPHRKRPIFVLEIIFCSKVL